MGGYFNDSSLIRRVHREHVVGLAGARALLMRDMLRGDVLHVSPQARQLGVDIVLHPPVPLGALALRELANFIIVGLLPGTLRRQYRLWWDPVRSLLLNAGAQSTRRVLMPVLPRRIRQRQGRPVGRLRTAD